MPYGLFRTSYLRIHYGRCKTCATGTQHPAHHSHIVKLALHFYAHVGAGH